MYRAALTLVVLAWFPTLASAQQPCTTDARHVVSELYRHILERQPDPGSSHWVEQLQSGRMTVREVVRGIVTSPEYDRRFIYTEYGEAVPYERSVARFYRHILGRQPDAQGQRDFAELAQQRGAEAVIDRILSSREYDQQFGAWGVPGSGGVRFCQPSGFSGTTGQIGSDQYSSYTFPPRYRVMDRNNDNVLTWNEWRGSRRTFAQHDLDGNGQVTTAEVAQLTGVVPTSGQANGQTVNVGAREQWTDTGLTVREGDLIMFDVSGTIQLSANGNDVAGPAGAFTGRRANESPLPNAPAGALLGRIGGQVFAVGDQRSLRAPASGRLYLGINDDHLPDNSGGFRVNVSVR